VSQCKIVCTSGVAKHFEKVKDVMPEVEIIIMNNIDFAFVDNCAKFVDKTRKPYYRQLEKKRKRK
jgi:hypothetical protein